MVAHGMGFAHDAADRIVLLRRGRVVENGSPEEIVDHPTDPGTRKFCAACDRV